MRRADGEVWVKLMNKGEGFVEELKKGRNLKNLGELSEKGEKIEGWLCRF